MIIVCAIIAGFGTSLLWVAHGRYVTLCADDSNKGFYNSVFWVFMMACQVIGNILGGTIITKVKQSYFFTGFTILALIAAVWMLGLPTPKPYPNAEKTEETEMAKVAPVDPETGKAEVAEIPAEVDNVTEDPRAAIVEVEESSKMAKRKTVGYKEYTGEVKVHPFVEMCRFLKTPRFMTFAPIIFFAGISMAVYAGLLIPLLSRSMGPTCPEGIAAAPDRLLAGMSTSSVDPNDTRPCVKAAQKTSDSCFAMIGIGAGEIIGSLVNGKLNDYFGIKKYLIICYTQLVIAFAFLFVYNQLNTFSMWFGALTMFWWGSQDAAITNFFLCVVGF